MDTCQKKILITGGLGYIGSHTILSLYSAGYKCIIVDNLSNSSIKTHSILEKLVGSKIPLVVGDILDNQILEDVFKNYCIIGVIHFAALKSVGESCEKPLKYFNNNINGLLSLLHVMNKYGIKNIIFSSSATVYDTAKTEPPYKESAPLRTLNPYGTTKLISELQLQDLAKFNDMNVISLRYFNPIGSHTSGMLGDDPIGTPSNILPYVFRVAIGKYPKLQIFGNDYNTPDGTCLRDYIHVMDLADAHIASYKYIEQLSNRKGFFEAINIGTGKPTSVLELVNIVQQITNTPIQYEFTKRRNGDAPTVFSNPNLAYTMLGWQPNFNVNDAVKDGWKFVVNNL